MNCCCILLNVVTVQAGLFSNCHSAINARQVRTCIGNGHWQIKQLLSQCISVSLSVLVFQGILHCRNCVIDN